MSDIRQSLAEYIAAVSDAAERTHSAADRPVYRIHLANAGVLLARAVRGESVAQLAEGLKEHDRLRSNTWLEGPERTATDAAWERIASSTPGVRAT